MCINWINAQKVDVTRWTDEKKTSHCKSRDFLRKRRLKRVYSIWWESNLGVFGATTLQPKSASLRFIRQSHWFHMLLQCTYSNIWNCYSHLIENLGKFAVRQLKYLAIVQNWITQNWYQLFMNIFGLVPFWMEFAALGQRSLETNDGVQLVHDSNVLPTRQVPFKVELGVECYVTKFAR